MNELRLTVNGELRKADPGTTVAGLLRAMGIDPARVAVEKQPRRRPARDLGARRASATATRSRSSPSLVVARAVVPGTTTPPDEPLILGGRKFNSRLLIGTGKYRTLEETREAILRSGAEIVTVALRRVDLTPGKPNVLDAIDRKRHTLLPNTAGCYTAEEAIRTCRLARELGIAELVKLEVIGDERTLFPDGAATLEAARVLVKEGFIVLPYCMRRSDPGAEARGRRLRGGDAAGGADRLGAGHPQPAQPAHHPRAARRCRSSSTPASARPPTRRSRWSWAATAC